ncbi:MAG: AAA family ATPase [Betaproteobacteria bacterium]|nr:AAA family ATPase [Betaproteobacteria bacterium]
MDVPPPDGAATLQQRLAAALRDPASFGPACASVRVIETHISWVYLTGAYAWKVKKAVDLGFLDFTSLESRHRYCEEELRLNRRTAPRLYLDVVPIVGSVERPVVGGAGPVLEWALKMREFSQDALLSALLARGALAPAHVDALAAAVARFHGNAARAPADQPWGSAGEVLDVALANFVELRPKIDDPASLADLEALEGWTRREHAARGATWASRRAAGLVRECHGDLHLGNIALVDDEVTLFDCIEFNERMRWIDVVSDIAFTVMDLQHRRRRDLAQRFLNAYLEHTGDYSGLAVLPYYLAYRAMVRAKVAGMRAAQMAPGEARSAALADCRTHVQLAKKETLQGPSAIVITRGLSGSGKTTLSQSLLERIGALRVRSDVERKRLLGLPADARTGANLDAGIYAADASRATYARLLALARAIVEAGRIALVDAAFLSRWQRDAFRTLANELDVPLVIVEFVASEATLRRRIVERGAAGNDASDADLSVLAHQLRHQEPLGDDERALAVTWDAEQPLARAQVVDAWRGVAQRLGVDDPPDDLASSTHDGASTPMDPGLDAKLAFLLRPQTYPETTTRVERAQTHLSWVFLTDAHAYKLKKPIRSDFVDLRTTADRRRNCRAEVRLNRRLAPDVYLCAVPITCDAAGRLAINGEGDVVDWLVRMRRLPQERMLDRIIASGLASTIDVDAIVQPLCVLYRAAPPVAMSAATYLEALAAEIDATRRALREPDYALPADTLDRIASLQSHVLERDRGSIGARASAGRIVEGHGDLRPEHVCMLSPPRIIDCLEFSRELRTLDPVDELAYLALECERLGAPELRERIFTAYRRLSGDAATEALIDFYQSYRAFIRAKIAIWHWRDTALRGVPEWRMQALDYLRHALAHAERSAQADTRGGQAGAAAANQPAPSSTSDPPR